MAIEYRGEEILFVVEIAGGMKRPFNQTDGSKTISADEIELSTKDKTGADYGAITEELSLEGILTEGDPFIDYIKAAIRNKEFVKIYEVNTRTKEAEYGMHMITNFERTYTNEEHATYTLDAKLNGSVQETTLTEIPDGAPDSGTGDDTGAEG